MSQRPPATSSSQARRSAVRLTACVEQVLAAHPDADPDNVCHTLILLEQLPLERLQRSLLRDRTTALRRRHKLKVLSLERILVSKLAANRAKDRLAIPVLRDALATTTAINASAKTRKAKRANGRSKP